MKFTSQGAGILYSLKPPFLTLISVSGTPGVPNVPFSSPIRWNSLSPLFRSSDGVSLIGTQLWTIRLDTLMASFPTVRNHTGKRQRSTKGLLEKCKKMEIRSKTLFLQNPGSRAYIHTFVCRVFVIFLNDIFVRLPVIVSLSRRLSLSVFDWQRRVSIGVKWRHLAVSCNSAWWVTARRS